MALLFVMGLVWAVFVASCLLLVTLGVEPVIAGPFRFDRLGLFLVAAISLTSGIIFSFSRRFLDRNKKDNNFFVYYGMCFLSIIGFLIADDLILLLFSWSFSGFIILFIVNELNFNGSKSIRIFFIISTILFSLGVTLLVQSTGALGLSRVVEYLAEYDSRILYLATACFIGALLTQGTLVPFHSWLFRLVPLPLPTMAFGCAVPASLSVIAAIHLAPVVAAVPGGNDGLFLVGLCGFVTGALLSSVQTDCRRALIFSTVAQISFAVLLCGLGMTAVAALHVASHGLWVLGRVLGSLSLHPLPVPEVPIRRQVKFLALAAISGGLASGAGFLAGSDALGGPADAGLVLIAFVVLAGVEVGARWMPNHPADLVAIATGMLVLGGTYGWLITEAWQWLTPALPRAASLSALHIGGIITVVTVAALRAAGLLHRSPWLYARLLAWGARVETPLPAGGSQ